MWRYSGTCLAAAAALHAAIDTPRIAFAPENIEVINGSGDGARTELGLVGRAVQRQQERIQLLLVHGVEALGNHLPHHVNIITMLADLHMPRAR